MIHRFITGMMVVLACIAAMATIILGMSGYLLHSIEAFAATMLFAMSYRFNLKEREMDDDEHQRS